MLKQWALMGAMTLWLAGCGTDMDPCAGFGPIYPTSADLTAASDALRDQVLAHNITGERLCGWRAEQ